MFARRSPKIARPELSWKRSSRCANAGCVEIAIDAAGVVHVRDSKRAKSPVLTFDRDEWAAFIAGAKESEFDL